jgi:hypothetical protein
MGRYVLQRRGLLRICLPLALSVGAIAAVAPTGAAAGGAKAVAARTQSFNISSTLHLIGHPGHVLNEQGTFSGTQSGTIAIRFTSVSSTSGEATFTAYPSGGSVSGRTSTKGQVVGAHVYFSGSMTITGGTGKWAHASGRGLGFSGVVDRRSFHASTHMTGTISL